MKIGALVKYDVSESYEKVEWAYGTIVDIHESPQGFDLSYKIRWFENEQEDWVDCVDCVFVSIVS
jgi:hypothetical protein